MLGLRRSANQLYNNKKNGLTQGFLLPRVRTQEAERASVRNAAYLTLCEELVRSGEVPQVGLQAERELQQEGPLCLHGGQHGLHHLGGRMVRDDERLAAVHHRRELALPPLQLPHQPLVVLLDLGSNDWPLRNSREY